MSEKFNCAVRGMVVNGAMCGNALVGGGCGFDGYCEHKTAAPTPPAGIAPFNPTNAASNMGNVFTGMAKPWQLYHAVGMPTPAQQKQIDDAVEAFKNKPAPEPICPYCDGTGDVYRADGEWLGTCDCRKTPEPISIGSMEPVGIPSINPVAWVESESHTYTRMCLMDAELDEEAKDGMLPLYSAEQLATLQAKLAAVEKAVFDGYAAVVKLDQVERKLATLQAKLEQAEKDKTELLARIKDSMVCKCIECTNGIKNAIAKYEVKKS